MKVVWTEQARGRLLEIERFIARMIACLDPDEGSHR